MSKKKFEKIFVPLVTFHDAFQQQSSDQQPASAGFEVARLPWAIAHRSVPTRRY
jgi:hypothetical protein